MFVANLVLLLAIAAPQSLQVERGMFDGPFKGYQQSFETHWREYLAAKESRDEALKQILLATGRPVTH